jgi:hypothetical protein
MKYRDVTIADHPQETQGYLLIDGVVLGEENAREEHIIGVHHVWERIAARVWCALDSASRYVRRAAGR